MVNASVIAESNGYNKRIRFYLIMRFPKQELDIDQYLQVIDGLLNDEECHLFIDTNIISQLYKLNDAARMDFLIG